MKTLALFVKKLTYSFSAPLFFNQYLSSLIFALITLSSCSYDDEYFSADVTNVSCGADDEYFSADVAEVIGTYTVVDTYTDGQIKNYDITISKGKDGGLEISNFGKIMYVPVKASIKGNAFTIPSQTFKGNNMTIIVSGLGLLNGTTLNFDYTIETGSAQIEHTCVASKNGNS
jgi:hypothetical protein